MAKTMDWDMESGHTLSVSRDGKYSCLAFSQMSIMVSLLSRSLSR